MPKQMTCTFARVGPKGNAEAHLAEHTGRINCGHNIVDGVWVAASNRLQTFTWATPRWRERLSEEKGEALLKKAGAFSVRGAMAATPTGLVAVTEHGVVLRYEKGAWTMASKPSPLFKERSHFKLAFDPKGNRLVAWGNEVRNRRTNDTLFFDGQLWVMAKGASPRAFDLAAKEPVEFNLYFDHGLQRVVRLSATEVGVLEGQVWKSYQPRGYADLTRSAPAGGMSAAERAFGRHVPVSDPETGETLLINYHLRTIVRLDLAACELVGTFVEPKVKKGATDGLYFKLIAAFDAAERTLQVHGPTNADRYALPLGVCFEAARSLGPRTGGQAPPA